MKSLIFLSMVVLLGFLGLAQEAETVDLDTLTRKMDELYRSKSIHATMEMAMETPHWKRTLKMELWGEGMKKTFIVIQHPSKDKGIATLRNGSEMWNFFPKTDKVMKVPPSMMMGSWMGSDFTNDDLVKESTFLDDYERKLLPSPAGQEKLHLLELKPKQQTISVWGRILIFIDKQSLLPVRQEYYDEKGTRMRVMTFSEIKEFSGRKMPAVMELVPDNKPGNKTIIRYLTAEFDVPLDASQFTLRNLQMKRE